MIVDNLKSLIREVFEKYGFLEGEQDFKIHFAHQLLLRGYSVSGEPSIEVSNNAYPEHPDLVVWDNNQIENIIEVKYVIHSSTNRRGDDVNNANDNREDKFQEDLDRIKEFITHVQGCSNAFALYITDDVNWFNDIFELRKTYRNPYSWNSIRAQTRNKECYYYIIVSI